MVHHPLVSVLAAARAAGVTLRVVNGEVAITGRTPPDAALVADMRRYRPDIAVLSSVAAELRASLTWCAEQLGPDDDPATLGYPCLKHFLTLSLDRSREPIRELRP